MKDKVFETAFRFLLGAAAAAFLFPVFFTILQAFVAPEEITRIYADKTSDIYLSFRCAILPRRFSFRQFYEVLLGSGEYMFSFWSSVGLSLVCTLFNLIVSVALGYILAMTRFRLRKAAVRFVVLMMLLPWQAMMLPDYILSRMLGIYDTRLVLVVIQGTNAFGVFLMYQFFKEVPTEMVEAAYLDTSPSVMVLTRIVCPAVRPGIIACAAIAFAESWNMVEEPLTLLETEWKYPLSMMINTMNIRHIEIGFACSAVYLFPMIAIAVFFREDMISGMTLFRQKGDIEI